MKLLEETFINPIYQIVPDAPYIIIVVVVVGWWLWLRCGCRLSPPSHSLLFLFATFTWYINVDRLHWTWLVNWFYTTLFILFIVHNYIKEVNY